MADDPDVLLAELGVTARNTEQIEQEVIHQAITTQQLLDGSTLHSGAATQAAGASADGAADGTHPAAAGGKAAAQGKELARVRAQLRAVTSEIKALQANQLAAAAVADVLDAAAAAAAPSATEEQGTDAFGQPMKRRKAAAAQRMAAASGRDGGTSGTASDAPAGQQQQQQLDASQLLFAGDAPGSSLQHALRQQRLQDLREQRQQLQAQLEALERSEQGRGMVGAGTSSATDTHAQQQTATGAAASSSRAAAKGSKKTAGKQPVSSSQKATDTAAAAQLSNKPVQVLAADDFDDLFASEDDVPAAKGNNRGNKARAQQGPGMIESERDRQIRLGLITPFGALQGFERKAKTVSTVPNPFDRRPLAASVMQAAGRAGKPLSALIQEMGDKTQAAVAARPTTRLVDADELPLPEREVRRIPAHFWQSAASERRLPPSADGVRAGGHIPNLAATRAPLPPVKRPRAATRRRGKQRRTADEGSDVHDDDDDVVVVDSHTDGGSTGSEQPARRQPRGGARANGAARAQTRQQRQADEDEGGGAFAGTAAQAVLAPGERSAARRAMQRLEQLAENEGEEDASISEESDYTPSEDDRPQQQRQRRHTGGRAAGRRARSSGGSDDEELEDDLADLEPEGDGNVAAADAPARRRQLRRLRRQDQSSEDAAASDGSAGVQDAADTEAAEDLQGQYDDADDAYYEQRVAAAAVRIAEEDEVAAAASVNGLPQSDEFGSVQLAGDDKKQMVDGKLFIKDEAAQALLLPKQELGSSEVKVEHGLGLPGVVQQEVLPAAATAQLMNAGVQDQGRSSGKVASTKAAVVTAMQASPRQRTPRSQQQTAQQQAPQAQGGEHRLAPQYAQLLDELQQGQRQHGGGDQVQEDDLFSEPGLVRNPADELGGDIGQDRPAAGPQRTRRRANGAGRVSRQSLQNAAEQQQQQQQQQGTQYVEFEGGLRIPLRVWNRLFGYQRVGVQWLWELHCQRVGGILGDEMGLGKTIQIVTYLAGLYESGKWPGPALIVCPATVMRQWLRECRRWAPQLRVVLMHDSARAPTVTAGGSGAPRPDRAGLLQIVNGSPCGVLLTSYEQLRLNRSLLLPVAWGAVILDEGHKIRNPDAEVTLAAKQLATPHRLVVSGSPIQNKLSELWSLFDFVFPGKLGTLPVFQAQFAVPIQIGGYTNANKLQVSTAYRCALVLRDLVAPHLLRRRKADVAITLPDKTEQVLFCTLVAEQLELYRAYLASPDVSEILENKRQALAGIDILRKITNHPDLLERLRAASAPDYGAPERSGKLTVTKKLLQHWSQGGHKTLLFCQTQQMLDIVEKLVANMGLTYHRMDGSTSVAVRSRLMDDFNTNPDIAVFLLTTKVGGLGVNLVGADRVLLYDPDWNPATDTQARERAWRIGQTRAVTIYRLITSGTIEEKVYHRQVYKSFLTNKVLKDPRQKRFFAAKDLHDLFTLGDEYTKRGSNKTLAAQARRALAGLHAGAEQQMATETARIFGDAGHDIEVNHEQLGGQQLAVDIVQPFDDGDVGVVSDGTMLDGMDETDEAEAGQAGGGMSSGAGGSIPSGRKRSREEVDGAGPSTGGKKGSAKRADDSDKDFEYGSGVARARPPPAKPAAAPRHDSNRLLQLSRAGNNVGMGMARPRSNGDVSSAPARTASPAVQQPHDQGGGNENDESKLLRDLFDGAGLRSLVDHSRVESANDPEALAAEAEATRVATRAAEALRRSRADIMRAPLNEPTWTGNSGAAGAPTRGISHRGASTGNGVGAPSGRGSLAPSGNAAPAARRFGKVTASSRGAAAAAGNSNAGARKGLGGGSGAAPSSAALLQQVRARQQGQLFADPPGRSGSPSATAEQAASAIDNNSGGVGGGSDVDAQGMDAQLLAAEIVSYLDAQGGADKCVASTQVMRAFRRRVADNNMSLFRQLLGQSRVVHALIGMYGLRARKAGS